MSRISKILFLFLWIACSLQGRAQVVANFTASTVSGCAPLTVNFTNSSTGATSYSWNLGNTNTSFFTNASAIYSIPGTYTVTLTASNASSSDSSSIQIVVHAPPIVSFSASDTLVCPGVSVSFSNNTNPVSAGAATYYWDFGDGNSSSAQSPFHVYQTPGYYTVTLTATNSDGCSASLSRSALIHIRSLPDPLFALNNTSFCNLPASVTFIDQTTGQGPFTYSWRFGDGGTSTLSGPTHSYASAGTYTITEIVTDANGCTDSVNNTNTVAINGLNGSFATPDSACINNTVTFVNTTTSPFISNYWDYGDGVSYTGNSPAHAYTSTGIYTVMLAIYNGHCYDTIRHNILVKQGPVVSVSISPSQLCPAPVTVQFATTGGTAGTTYKWYFGDGDSSTGAGPSHLYTSDSFFVVKLNATDFCTSVVIDTVKLYNFLPKFDLAPYNFGCAPLTVDLSFHASTNVPYPHPPPLILPVYPYPYPITSYQYIFGDGSPSVTTSAVNHIYANPGVYYPSLIITFGAGCTDTFRSTVNAGQAPVLDHFSVSRTQLCRNDTLTFKGKATGLEPLIYEYIFPQQAVVPLPDSMFAGVDDTVQNSFQFAAPGLYKTYLNVSNYGCPSVNSQYIYVTVDSPGAQALPPKYSCDSPLYVTLSDTSAGATSRLWIFGDGTTDTAARPKHYFPAGFHVPVLAVANSTSGCKDTTIVPLNSSFITPRIIIPDTAICQNSIWTLTAAVTISGTSSVSYIWNVNNVFVDTSVHIIFPSGSTGYNTVALYAKDDHGCQDTATRLIFVSQPAAGAVASPTQACVGSTVVFTDTSHDTPGAYIVSRAWTFGDGSASTVSTASTGHPYSSQNNFSVKEIVTDNNGCTDSVYKSSYIHTHRPTANFTVGSTIHCIGDMITFTNTGTPNPQTSYWTFGDGGSSFSAAPVHSYSATGTYAVSLAIIDSTGCNDTLTRTAYITISKPHAAFTDNDSTGICTPLVVNFANTSVNGTSYAWNFGNTNTSIATSPSNSYSVPGNYTVQLIVTDAHGCTDTAYHHISLYGYSGTFSYTPLSGCPPLSVNFTANITNIPSITWDLSDGTVIGPSSGNTLTHIYNSPGKYVPKIVLGDSSGCHTSITGADTIRIDEVVAGFKETTSICIYDTVHFTDTSSSMFSALGTWYWTLGDGATTFSRNPAHMYHSSGNFSVMLIATDAAGCRDTITNTILVHPLPLITATGDTSICPGDSARVTATGGVSYTWGPVATINCTSCDPTFVAPVAPTTYIAIGTDAFGCKNKDSVKIGSRYKTISYAGPGGQVCLGQSITLSDSGAQSYTWYPTTGLSGSHTQFPVATPDYSITYLAIAKTASCIPDTNHVNVIVNPLPKVIARGSGTVLAGDKLNLQASGPDILYFEWDHPDLLSCDSCTNPIATMQQTTWFTVTATNEYGCRDTAGVLVNVLCDKSQVFIPNTFTPNGDGQNDVFYPRGIGIRIVRSFRIYNRWGELVFQRNNISLNDEGNGWDGTFNGAKPVPDTYVYALDAICDDGQPIDWKGDVTLIK